MSGESIRVFIMNMLHKIFWNFINAVTRYDCHDYIDRKMYTPWYSLAIVWN